MAVQSKDRSSANFTVHLRREDDILSKPLRQVKLRILPKHQSHRNYVEEPDFGKVFFDLPTNRPHPTIFDRALSTLPFYPRNARSPFRFCPDRLSVAATIVRFLPYPFFSAFQEQDSL